MLAIFLVTVFSCLLATANADSATLGATCTATDGCTDTNAVCSSTSSTCVCKPGYTQYSGSCVANGSPGTACLTTSPYCTGDNLVCESSVCKVKAGQTCATTSECVSQSTCSTTCNCNSGYTPLTTGFCNGAAPQSVSSWLLTGSSITLMVTLCLPWDNL